MESAIASHLVTTTYSRPSYRQAVEVLSRIWTLLPAVQKCCWHVSQHTSLSITVQFPPKPNWPERSMLWVLYQQYNNVEQHRGQHIAVYTTTPQHNCRVQRRLPQVTLVLSMLSCWWADLFPGVLYTLSSFILQNISLLCMPSATIQWTLQQHSKPAHWKEQLKTFMQDGQSYVWASGGREREGIPFNLEFLSIRSHFRKPAW